MNYGSNLLDTLPGCFLTILAMHKCLRLRDLPVIKVQKTPNILHGWESLLFIKCIRPAGSGLRELAL